MGLPSALSFLVASPLAPVRLTFVPLGHGLNLSTADIWGLPVLCCRGCPELCRMLGSLPTLYPQEALCSTPEWWRWKMSPDLGCQLSPGRHNFHHQPPHQKTNALDLSSNPHPLSPLNSALIVITLHEDAAPHGGGKRHPQSAASSACHPIPRGSGIAALLCLSLSLFCLPSPPFSLSASWTHVIWKVPFFISASLLLKRPAQFKKANAVMRNQLIK